MLIETNRPDQHKIFLPNYVQIPAFGPLLVGLENVQEYVFALLFAHLSFCHIKEDLIQLNSHLTNKTKKQQQQNKKPKTPLQKP